MRGRVPAIVVAAAVIVALAHETARAADRSMYRTPLLVQTGLDLDVAVDYEKPALNGTATLTLVNVGKQPLREVPVLLNRLMSIREARDAAGRKLPVGPPYRSSRTNRCARFSMRASRCSGRWRRAARSP